MSESIFEIAGPEATVEQIVHDVQESVARKRKQGVYTDARVARAERANLAYLQDDEQFLGFYLKCLRDAVFIDISDFEIRERRAFLGPLLVMFKTVVWKLLKFYTYRLWSQQNEVNGMIITAVEGLDEKYVRKIAELEERISKLEQK